MYSHIIVNQAEYTSTGHTADIKNIQAGVGIEMHLVLLVFTCTKLKGLLYDFIKKDSYEVNSMQKAIMKVMNLTDICNVLCTDILI